MRPLNHKALSPDSNNIIKPWQIPALCPI